MLKFHRFDFSLLPHSIADAWIIVNFSESLPLMNTTMLDQFEQHASRFQQIILNKQTEIEAWFRAKWHQHTPPFYGSVDLRNAGYKISSIDMNLFPGGFNNINTDFVATAVIAAQDAVERACPTAKSVLLVPENHTRNTFYLQNVYALSKILESAGFEVRIGSLNPEITEASTFATALGNELVLEPLQRQGNRLTLQDGFDPCFVLLNNDLSAGVPEILQGVEQQMLPPLKGGWTTRRKTQHFAAYDIVAKEFAELIGIDPWDINPYFEQANGINFHEREGEDQLAEVVQRLLDKIQAKYDEKGITDTPFVIVKADAGTYGMGVMSVKSADEVRKLNRKNRNKMAVVKEGLEVSEVIVQEGIYTYEKVGEAVSEPVVYMMDRFVIGGFYRVNEARGIDENLNATGMRFIPMDREVPYQCADADKRHFSQWASVGVVDKDLPATAQDNRFYVYGVMARLSLLAAAIELE